MSTKAKAKFGTRHDPDTKQLLLCLELHTNDIGLLPDPEQQGMIYRLFWRRTPEELAELAIKSELLHSVKGSLGKTAAAG